MSKKVIISAALISLASLSSFAGAEEIKVIPMGEAAWVSVTDAGKPVQGAVVTTSATSKEFTTNENGHVYIQVGDSKSVKFTTVDSNGEAISAAHYFAKS